MKNKRGWTKVLEVFIAILLLASILIIILNSQGIQESKKTERIYKEQAFALKIVQLDDDLRNGVMNANSGINSDDGSFPKDVNDSINNALPDYLICRSAICLFGEACDLTDAPEKKDIYAKSILITTNLEKYETRELKLFCWEK